MPLTLTRSSLYFKAYILSNVPAITCRNRNNYDQGYGIDSIATVVTIYNILQ